jgi:hypothetical protein
MTAPTTLKGFYDALKGITITGVSTTHDAPPASINTADLPAKWVEFPENDENPITFQSNGGWPELRGTLVVALVAVALDTQDTNFTSSLTYCDRVNSALRALTPLTLGKGIVTWTLKPGIVSVAGLDYWGVVCEVIAHG